MKSDNNKVYLFSSSSNSFKLIYDFSALTGDTIEIYNRSWAIDSTTTVVVDSVSTININGTVLGVQYVSQPFMQEFYMSGTIIENIGWTEFMFPLHSWADPPYGGELRCFQNDSIGLYNPSGVVCDFITTEIESINNTNNFSVYPNPTHGIITISIPNNVSLTNTTVSLSDVSGREVLNHFLNSRKTELNVNHMPNGIYFLKINTVKGNLVKKLILTNH